MKSKWMLILCLTMSIFLFGGPSTVNAHPSRLLTSNLINNNHNKPYGYPFQNKTSLSNKAIPSLLSHAGIPIKNILISDNTNNPFLTLSEGEYRWHTFYGSTNSDSGVDITLDGNGNIYIIGYSSGPWNGPTGQAPLHAYSGDYDIMLLKLDKSGAYLWHTFFGSTDTDGGYSIALDVNGDVYITGYSRATWNGPTGEAPLHAYSGDYDIMLLKLDNSGAYQWHTFYGSTGTDGGYSIALDVNGGLFITGSSHASWNGPDEQVPLHPYSTFSDIVVLRLDNSGTYQWHTFYGSANDDGFGIALDGSGGVYITGESDETWNGPSGQTPLHAHSGDYDIMLLKLNNSGAYQWHTFFGGTSYDDGVAVELDSEGGVYITGNSRGSWNGPEVQEPLHAYNALSDIMVLKLNSSGVYQWHTFYGSVNNDAGSDICVDGQGDIYIAIDYSATVVGYGDIMVLKLDALGAFQWDIIYSSTHSFNKGITLDGYGGLYTTGQSFSTWNGPEGQTPLHPYNYYPDIMALKLHDSAISYSTYLPIIVK